MSAHNILQELYGTAESELNLMDDPGDGGRIGDLDVQFGLLNLDVTEAGTTRRLYNGLPAGTVILVTNAGSESVDVYDGAENSDKYFELAAGDGLLLVRNSLTTGDVGWLGVPVPASSVPEPPDEVRVLHSSDSITANNENEVQDVVLKSAVIPAEALGTVGDRIEIYSLFRATTYDSAINCYWTELETVFSSFVITADETVEFRLVLIRKTEEDVHAFWTLTVLAGSTVTQEGGTFITSPVESPDVQAISFTGDVDANPDLPDEDEVAGGELAQDFLSVTYYPANPS